MPLPLIPPRSATGHSAAWSSPECVSGPTRDIAGAPWAWKDRTRHRWPGRGKAGTWGRGKRRRHSRWYRHIDRTRLRSRECDEGRADRPNCDDTNECLHLVIIEQVACDEDSQRLIQFDGEGISFWLKNPQPWRISRSSSPRPIPNRIAQSRDWHHLCTSAAHA